VIPSDNSHSIFVRLHHDLIGLPIALATNRIETFRHKGSVVEGIVEQLDFPSVLPVLLFVFDDVLLDDFDLFDCFRRAVDRC